MSVMSVDPQNISMYFVVYLTFLLFTGSRLVSPQLCLPSCSLLKSNILEMCERSALSNRSLCNHFAYWTFIHTNWSTNWEIIFGTASNRSILLLSKQCSQIGLSLLRKLSKCGQLFATHLATRCRWKALVMIPSQICGLFNWFLCVRMHQHANMQLQRTRQVINFN